MPVIQRGAGQIWPAPPAATADGTLAVLNQEVLLRGARRNDLGGERRLVVIKCLQDIV